MTVAVLDLDGVKYTAGFAGEKRKIVTTERETGIIREFENRTAFYGRNKKAGWLSQYNKDNNLSLSPNDFEIEDVQIAQPIQNVLQIAKTIVEASLRNLGASSYKAFVGRGDSFRLERSTVWGYKQNRKDMLKPIYIQEIEDYLIYKYGAKVVTDIEADDACVMEAYRKNNHVIVSTDKDYLGCPVNIFNPDHPDWGVQSGDCFGNLWIDSKGEVRGIGRIFFYFQIASGDSSDNYKANSASDIEWGDKSAFNQLISCTDDKQALSKLVDIYRYLYPEKREIEGWRGDRFEVDWLYMLKENFDLARIRRFEGDEVDVENLLKRMELID